jgi:dihydrofolate reductase
LVDKKLKRIIIAAVSSNGVIGLNNRIPWINKQELKHFKETTLGHPVIMGRKTYDSIFKPLRVLHRVSYYGFEHSILPFYYPIQLPTIRSYLPCLK